MIRVPLPAPAGPGGRVEAAGRSSFLSSFTDYVRVSGGWQALALVVLMSLTVAWSIGDARWVLGRPELTAFLPWAVVAGVLWGWVAAAAGWSRWLAHLLGALVAALVLSVIVGSVLVTVPSSSSLVPPAPGESFLATIAWWFDTTASSTIDAWIDLAIKGRATTQQLGHFLLLLGILCWATGYFAAYTTFHHRRPANAFLLVGAILVANMSLTIRDQFSSLVLFTVAGLLLLVRQHALDEQQTWFRHHVWRAGALGTNNYLPGGLGFLLGAVLGALLLTGVASSAPLASFWSDADSRLIDIGRQITRFLPAGGQTRINGVAFGANAPITGQWVTDNTPVMRIQVPDDQTYYWRAITYERFTGTSWTLTSTVTSSVPTGADVLKGTDEGAILGTFRREVTFTVQPIDRSLQLVVSPNAPVSVTEPTKLTLVQAGSQTYFASLGTTDDQAAYQITASVPLIDPDGKAGITANRLRAAGTNYPAEVKGVYTEILPGTVGNETKALLSTILAQSRATNPYDIARALESYLKNPVNFHYDTNVSDVDCGGRSAVDCFVFSRRGYCEHYASTMAMMLRLEGIPARVVEGFLPGDRQDGVELVTRSRSHAWVEAYFPSYGWIDFDPTGGGIGRTLTLPAGPVVPIPSAGASPSASAGSSSGARPSPGEVRPRLGAEPGGSTTGRGGIVDERVIYIVLTILLAAGIGGLALAAYLRSGGGTRQPESVYRGISRIARRLGHGPQPTQTVFEYLDTLGQALPTSRPELEVVGAATVEVAYGRRQLTSDRLVALRVAERRLRLALLRLVVRRPRLAGMSRFVRRRR